MRKYLSEIMESPLFATFTKEEMASMLDCMEGKVKKYQKNEIIILSSEHVQYVGVILEGCIHMVKENHMGDRALLTIIEKGELFGESFACGDYISSYTTFMAAENTTVFFLPFQKIMYACNLRCTFHHRLIENMVIMLANKNVRLMQKIDVSSRKTLRDKVIAYLEIQEERQQNQQPNRPLRSKDRKTCLPECSSQAETASEQDSRTASERSQPGPARGWSRIELNMSRTVLAEYLGVNRSALTRELARMKEEGLIDFEKNVFYIKHS